MFLSPDSFPPLSVLLDAVPASRSAIADHLHISKKTMARYEANEWAPRQTMLAVFWESSYGRSTVNADLERRYQIYSGLARSLRDREDVFRRQIAAMEKELQAKSMAANLPVFKVG